RGRPGGAGRAAGAGRCPGRLARAGGAHARRLSRPGRPLLLPDPGRAGAGAGRHPAGARRPCARLRAGRALPDAGARAPPGGGLTGPDDASRRPAMAYRRPWLSPLSIVSGVEWPAVVDPAVAPLAGLLYQLEETQWWSPEDLLERQMLQLRLVLAHAARQTRFYRR